MNGFSVIPNNGVLRLSEMPKISVPEFREGVIKSVQGGERIAALFGHPAKDGAITLIVVLASEDLGVLSIARTEVKDTYPALTPDCPQAHWFEREIAECWGVVPDKHPWLKPIRFHRPMRPKHDAWGRDASQPILPCVTDFYRVRGEEVHQVAVGPVHAGIIEPGHFRFQCHGEDVFHLEISLGYQHRGIEKAITGGPSPRTIHYMETLAGDTSIGHATAYCDVVEALSGTTPPLRALAIRAIALELERLANHTGDLGALAADIGFLPTASFCGRIRGDFLNMTALLCGSRFGRGIVRPGGVAFDLDAQKIGTLVLRLETALKDVAGAAGLLWSTPSVLSRFEDTGRVSRETCDEIGLVGPPARACGSGRDVRFHFPSGMFRFQQMPVSTGYSGDVFSRAHVRWLEIQRSAAFINGLLKSLPVGSLRTNAGPLHPESLAVSLVEGWRGEICHVALTDAAGKFVQYKVVDPSFHNWMGLSLALRGQQISDFPLCNKSFNLSYCGHDL